jgi:positive regulator of sigma E activity
MTNFEMVDKNYNLEVGDNVEKTVTTVAVLKYLVPMIIIGYIVYKIFSYIDLYINQNTF